MKERERGGRREKTSGVGDQASKRGRWHSERERDLGDMSMKEFEKEFGPVDDSLDESLNDEVQTLMDSFRHLEESEWKDKINEFLLCDHPPIPLEVPKASEEKSC